MITVLGEALIDLVAEPGGAVFHALPGGAPMNVAVAIARLGGRVRFLGRTSRDPFGARLRAHLTAEGVDLAGAPVGDEPTALAVVTTDAAGHPTYRFLWETTADRQLSLAELPASLDDDAALVVGSVSTALEPGASAIDALVAREAAHRTVVLDPNVRPQFVADPGAYRARVEQLAARSDVVKISDEDLRWLADADPAATARRWLTGRTTLVVVTRGRDGASAFHAAGAEVTVAAEAVRVVDTVGAGDSALAAVVQWLAEHDRLHRHQLPRLDRDELTAMLRFAAHVSAVTCSRRGADPPRRTEL